MAVPYNTWADVGGYDERIAPGCFNASVRATPGLPLLLFHDNQSLGALVGHATSWDDRADGLWGTWQLDNTAEAQEAARKADGGFLLGLSVGFQRVKDDVEEVAGRLRFTRRQARLLEVSLTPTPAYVGGAVADVRSAGRPSVPAGVSGAQQADVLIGAWVAKGGPSYARMQALEAVSMGWGFAPGVVERFAQYAAAAPRRRRR